MTRKLLLSDRERLRISTEEQRRFIDEQLKMSGFDPDRPITTERRIIERATLFIQEDAEPKKEKRS